MQSEAEQKEFIKLYGAILRVTNILSSFDEFKDEELINERDKQDYHSIYIHLYNEFKKIRNAEKQRVPMIIVLGDNEVANRGVALRDRRAREQKDISLDEFYSLVQTKLNEVNI